MEFARLPVLDHPLVHLRPITEDDLPVWFEYLSLPQVFERTSWDLKSAREDLQYYVWNPAARTASTLLRLAVARNEDDQLVGTGGFHTVQPRNRSAEIAFDLSPAWWGRGIARALCGALVEWAHDEAGIVRVQGTTLVSNVGSQRVLEACGFEREGLLRSYRMVRGTPGDFWMYSHVEAPRTR